jgi:hypothetical protein
MSRWRIAVVLGLVVVPFVAMAGVGSFFLWQTGWGLWLWWPLFALMTLGYLLGWHWQRQRRLLHPVDFTAPLYWTDRDREAWRLVESRAAAAAKLEPAALAEVDTYFQTAKDMALELARFYHPKAQDPIGSLTIPEMLAVVELATQDLADMVDRYVPAGHLLTVDNWRQARKAADWYRTASNIYWAVSAIFAPLNTAARYAATKAGLGKPWQMLQQNLLVWFYTAFVHRLGTYLIELNSGRLKVGARRYRELLRTHGPAEEGAVPPAEPSPGEPAPSEHVRRVTITLAGQVKVGKSSLVNALLGERRAVTDVLPVTAAIARYELQPESVPSRLVLLDTVGYGHRGPRPDQLRATTEAAQQSELMLLVLHARNPARQADEALLKELRGWFAERPELRRQPILAVVTHIDLLSPALEWSPPYDWQKPQRPKEQQIAQAVAAVREQLGEYLAGVIPVCTAEGKVYGVEEWLLPAVTALLDEMHAVALVRCLRAEIDAGKVRRVFDQLLAAGKELAKVVWQGTAK